MLEIIVESVFSTGGLLGHLSYILLIVSMLSWKMYWLRVGVIASALAGIAYALIILNDPVAVFWESLLLIVNLFQLVRLILAERPVSLSEEESKMVRTAFSGLSELDARRLIDQGFWIEREAGTVLIREGTAVDNLYYLSSGMAEVRSRDKIVGHCKFGLQAGIFTRDLFKTLDAWDHLDVGGVVINDVPSYRVDNMPYGGVKDSGLGREGIRFAMEDMTEIRNLVIRRKAG